MFFEVLSLSCGSHIRGWGLGPRVVTGSLLVWLSGVRGGAPGTQPLGPSDRASPAYGSEGICSAVAPFLNESLLHLRAGGGSGHGGALSTLAYAAAPTPSGWPCSVDPYQPFHCLCKHVRWRQLYTAPEASLGRCRPFPGRLAQLLQSWQPMGPDPNISNPSQLTPDSWKRRDETGAAWPSARGRRFLSVPGPQSCGCAHMQATVARAQ